ncbi:uncharacterized protein LOC135106994 [Scylla paramamosain]|uniref:uncharacterized protein LOC135106994 n=1 Tax=Scylla paramamosain TaxID=85552 RepID=UPI003083E88D
MTIIMHIHGSPAFICIAYSLASCGLNPPTSQMLAYQLECINNGKALSVIHKCGFLSDWHPHCCFFIGPVSFTQMCATPTSTARVTRYGVFLDGGSVKHLGEHTHKHGFKTRYCGHECSM